MKIIVCLLVGYLFGCIQTAYILGKIVKGIDIREHGSNNAGASNAVMVMGWKFGIIVALCDILKATIPIIIIKSMFPGDYLILFACGVGVVLGHIFPVFLKFKGGKGTASIVGMALGIHSWMFIIMAVLIVLITILSDYIVIGTAVMVIAFPIITYLFGFGIIAVVVSISIAGLSFFKHRKNYARIMNGTEKGLRACLK